jgi:hypothetical protein
MPDTYPVDPHEVSALRAALRDQLLRDASGGESLPMTHLDQAVDQVARAASVAERRELLLSVIRAMLEEGLMVMGKIGDFDRVDSWGLKLDDAMARLRETYVVDFDSGNWVFGVWFALTESGERAAGALSGEHSG